MSIERFVVDARLLRELGERLVGKPHIALAELIKNSYDADARIVDIYFTDDEITVIDDGHGMSRQAFIRRWLTIGTTVKEQDRVSPELKRPFTGSKGVGRLAVQLLARKLELRTVGLRDLSLAGSKRRRSASQNELHSEVTANIDWDSAIRAGYIDNVDVEVDETPPSDTFADGSACGMKIILTQLTHEWDANSFRELARELWPLQPPFDMDEDNESAFQVRLHSPYEAVVREFQAQMRAILDIWTARITGSLLPVGATPPNQALYELRNDSSQTEEGESSRSRSGVTRLLQVKLEIRRSVTRIVTFTIPNCLIDQLSYEIRIFSLQHRQPQGVKVETARQYLIAYGGVHIYDAKFHLPYYGPDTDWLKIEQDHARRLSVSRLLPHELQVSRGMLDLAPNTRLYGSVNISTTHEAQTAERNNVAPADVLTVQITRDRLADNPAYDQLRRLVRTGMDFHAMETARLKFAQVKQRRDAVSRPPSSNLRDAERQFRSLRDSIPESRREEFDEIGKQVSEAISDAEAIESVAQTQTALLAALATAGMVALAYEHEVSKQVADMNRIARRIKRISRNAPQGIQESLTTVSDQLISLADRTNRIKAIFAPLSDEETRNSQDVPNILDLISELDRTLEVLSRGTEISYDGIPRNLYFPRGGYPAWWAILQNLLINSLNATLDTEVKKIRIDGSGNQSSGWIRVQDTGVGIDLDEAERLFEPFERGTPISRERAALALGGSGLGLTIVRLVADELEVDVDFEPPQQGYNTSVRIAWRPVK